ncbi:MAG: 2-deoxyribose-5-phosphate aldolase [Sporichthyaceae bacterium]
MTERSDTVVLSDLDLVLSLTDLTLVTPGATEDDVRTLCRRAIQPDPDDVTAPRVAAVCVLPGLVTAAVDELTGTGITVAAVAGDFPTGQAPLEQRLDEVSAALAAGASEIEWPIDRTAFLDGRKEQVGADVIAVRALGDHFMLKVILGSDELPSDTQLRLAVWTAAVGGADMVKSCTGRGSGLTDEDARTMVASVNEYGRAYHRLVGVKFSGQVRTAERASELLTITRAIDGDRRLNPAQFRFGASALLDDVIEARRTVLRNLP